MPATESIHKKLLRVRKPVNSPPPFSYFVNDDDLEPRSLPFVVGVMGDFSGDPTKELRPLADRKFIDIDRDNFDDVMKRMTPGLDFKVENTLKGDGTELSVQIEFKSLDDFSPANVVEQVEPLHGLLATRRKLQAVVNGLEANPEFAQHIGALLIDQSTVNQLAAELGVQATSDKEK